jgi:hypothetical protein
VGLFFRFDFKFRFLYCGIVWSILSYDSFIDTIFIIAVIDTFSRMDENNILSRNLCCFIKGIQKLELI